MKVLLFLPRAFEHMESGAFIDVMGWARYVFKLDIQLETCGFAREVPSAFGAPVVVDRLISGLSADCYDALALPGGFQGLGYLKEAYDERLLKLIREFDSVGKTIASVCVASLALGKSGILNGRRATTYSIGSASRMESLRRFNAAAVEERIVRDGNIITSCGPETAVWVAFKLLELMSSPDDADKVKNAMGYTKTP